MRRTKENLLLFHLLISQEVVNLRHLLRTQQLAVEVLNNYKLNFKTKLSIILIHNYFKKYTISYNIKTVSLLWIKSSSVKWILIFIFVLFNLHRGRKQHFKDLLILGTSVHRNN